MPNNNHEHSFAVLHENLPNDFVFGKTWISNDLLSDTAHIKSLYLAAINTIANENAQCSYDPLAYFAASAYSKILLTTQKTINLLGKKDGYDFAIYLSEYHLIAINFGPILRTPYNSQLSLLTQSLRHELHHAAKYIMHGPAETRDNPAISWNYISAKIEPSYYADYAMGYSALPHYVTNPMAPFLPFTIERHDSLKELILTRILELQNPENHNQAKTIEYQPALHRVYLSSKSAITKEIVSAIEAGRQYEYLYNATYVNSTMVPLYLNGYNALGSDEIEVYGHTVINQNNTSPGQFALQRDLVFKYDQVPSAYEPNMVVIELETMLAELSYVVRKILFPELDKMHSDEFNTFLENCPLQNKLAMYDATDDSRRAFWIANQMTCLTLGGMNRDLIHIPKNITLALLSSEKELKKLFTQYNIASLGDKPMYSGDELSVRTVQKTQINLPQESHDFLANFYTSPWYFHAAAAFVAYIKKQYFDNLSIDNKMIPVDLENANIIRDLSSFTIRVQLPLDVASTYDVVYAAQNTPQADKKQNFLGKIYSVAKIVAQGITTITMRYMLLPFIGGAAAVIVPFIGAAAVARKDVTEAYNKSGLGAGIWAAFESYSRHCIPCGQTILFSLDRQEKSITRYYSRMEKPETQLTDQSSASAVAEVAERNVRRRL